jgi:hypothetical protein
MCGGQRFQKQKWVQNTKFDVIRSLYENYYLSELYENAREKSEYHQMR